MRTKTRNEKVLNTKTRFLLYISVYITALVILTNIVVYMMTAVDKYTTDFGECYVSDIIENDNTITYSIVKLDYENNKELWQLQLNKKNTLDKDLQIELEELSKVKKGDYFICTIRNHYTYKKIFGFVIEDITPYISKLGIYTCPEVQLPELYDIINS